MKENKTDLKEAFDRLRELNLETTAKQFIELADILHDLANDQFEKGMKATTEIYNKIR